MSPHTGAAITLPPDFEDPHVLDLEVTALCALLTLFLQRAKEVGGGDRHSVKHGSACLRSAPIHMLLKARLSITHNHTEAAASEARQLGAGKAGDCISLASANAHSAYPRKH